MINMITIDEAIQANDKVIAICVLVFVILSFVAWVVTIRRERRMKRRITKAVTKAEARAIERTRKECHEKALDNFIHWMDTRIELKKVTRERDELRRKYDLLRAAAEGCPGVTSAKI
jgi:hypothetical protein